MLQRGENIVGRSLFRHRHPVKAERDAGDGEDIGVPFGSAADERPHTGERPTQESQGQHAAVIAVELGKDAAGTPVIWRVSTKGSPHSFVLGIPGQRTHAVNQTAWEAAEIVAYVCGLGEIQRGHVFDGLRQAYTNAAGVPSMAQFAAAVEDTEREARGKNARDRIRPLVDFGLFADAPGDTFLSSWSDGAVVDLSGLTLETVQLAAGAFILRKIYREMFRWGQADPAAAGGCPRRGAPARQGRHAAKADEGRQEVRRLRSRSQGISDFHKDVLGNAGAKIIFRTNYPESRTTAGFLRSSDGQDLSQQLEQLGVDTAYVSVPDHVRARKVYMSPN